MDYKPKTTFAISFYIKCSCSWLQLVGMASRGVQDQKQNTFDEFVEDLRLDLGLNNQSPLINESGQPPLPSQSAKTPKRLKCSRRKRKVMKSKLSTSCQGPISKGSCQTLDVTEKIVRNLVINQRTVIEAYTAKFVETNFYLTDENQGGDKYHAVSADTDWLRKATDHLILCRTGVVSPNSRGPLHVELFNMKDQSLTIAEFSSVAKLITHHYDY